MQKTIDFHDAVRRLRSECGESQEQFARRLGVGVRTITRYESDKPPSEALLLKLWRLAKDKHLDTVADALTQAVPDSVAVFLSDPTFIREWTHRFHPATGEMLSEALRLRGITDEERHLLRAALAKLRSDHRSDRELLIEAIRNPTGLRRARRRAALLDDIERKLQTEGEAGAHEDERG